MGGRCEYGPGVPGMGALQSCHPFKSLSSVLDMLLFKAFINFTNYGTLMQHSSPILSAWWTEGGGQGVPGAEPGMGGYADLGSLCTQMRSALWARMFTWD